MKVETIEEYNALSGEIISAAIEVHKLLGPGLLEVIYEESLMEELHLRGIKVEHQLSVPIFYKGKELGQPLKLDLLVEDSIIVELKTSKELADVHSAQLLSYLKLSGKKLGLLINFNSVRIKDGLRRIVNGL